MDGTLTDPAPGIVACLEYALQKMGAPEPDDLNFKRFIGPPLQETFCELLGTSASQDIEAAMAYYRERFTDVGLFENSLYSGIPQALSALADEGFELRVATSKPRVFADRIIDHFGLRRFFSRVYGSELSGERTDKGDLIQYILETESLEPGCACMIGDRRHDVLGAQRHGVLSIGVLWGFGDQEELELVAPHKIVKDVRDLVRTVRELTGNCY
ncbi:MAG: HAD hydrolase-like protein [Gimesia sp.]